MSLTTNAAQTPTPRFVPIFIPANVKAVSLDGTALSIRDHDRYVVLDTKSLNYVKASGGPTHEDAQLEANYLNETEA